jgi:tripartite-type tricarboxylate transporter receptor subunit TctC
MRLLATLLAVVAIAGAAGPAAAQAYVGPVVLLVNPKAGIKTLADLVAAGHKSARPLTFASDGANSSGHRLTEKFAAEAGIKVQHVPYRGPTQAIVDLIAGVTDFAALPAFSVVGQIRGGLLVALALAAKERLPQFPDLPTFAESGYPAFVGATP